MPPSFPLKKECKIVDTRWKSVHIWNIFFCFISIPVLKFTKILLYFFTNYNLTIIYRWRSSIYKEQKTRVSFAFPGPPFSPTQSVMDDSIFVPVCGTIKCKFTNIWTQFGACISRSRPYPMHLHDNIIV